jgi:hypothetical protein
VAIAFDADLGSTQVAASSGTVALTTAAAVAAGGLIVVAVSSASTVSLSSVGDGTNTYSLLGPATNVDSHRVWLAYAIAASGLASSSTITATFSAGTAERMIGAISFTGIDSGTPVTGTPSTRTSTNETTFNGPAITPADANAVVVGFHITDGAGNPQATTPNTGFTIQLGSTSPNDEWNFVLGGAQKAACMMYRIVSSIAAYTPGGVWDESQAGGSQAHIAAAFKAAAGATGRTLFEPRQPVHLLVR